ncbi:hypothetical protein B0H19DRAFT_1268123 [Mycena capillaripes]|nr:hypothetical protein B0H19DRAFT_1268123 [Mycena capillaripes]
MSSSLTTVSNSPDPPRDAGRISYSIALQIWYALSATPPTRSGARSAARPTAAGFEQPSAPLYIVGPCHVAIDETPGTAWAHWKHDANITLQQTYMDAARPLRLPLADLINDLRQDTAGKTSSTRVAHRCCCPTCTPPPSFSYPRRLLVPPAIDHVLPAIRRCGPSPHPATTPRLRAYVGNMCAHVTTTGASGVASGCLASTSAMHTRDNTEHCHISALASPFSRGTRSRSSKDWGYGARRSALQHGCNYCPL